MNLLDWLTIISYFAINIEILIQARHIYRTKSSADLSMAGMLIRFVAIIIILTKFVSLGDMAVLIGQIFVVMTFTTYFLLAIHYRLRPKKKRRA